MGEWMVAKVLYALSPCIAFIARQMHVEPVWKRKGRSCSAVN